MGVSVNVGRVLVRVDEYGKTDSGLFIPQSAEEGMSFKIGTVHAAGDPRTDASGNDVSLPLRPGARVLFDSIGGQKVTVDGRELLCIRGEDVVCELLNYR